MESQGMQNEIKYIDIDIDVMRSCDDKTFGVIWKLKFQVLNHNINFNILVQFKVFICMTILRSF